MLLPNLSELLNYRHEDLINSYIRNFGSEKAMAEILFDDMLRYLWVSAKHEQDRAASPDTPHLQFSLVMQEEMRSIDEMWHNFILYTRDYTHFCQRYFGQYLHHQPDMALSLTLTEIEFSQQMELYLSYLWTHLGEEVVCRWFSKHLIQHAAA